MLVRNKTAFTYVCMQKLAFFTNEFESEKKYIY